MRRFVYITQSIHRLDFHDYASDADFERWHAQREPVREPADPRLAGRSARADRGD